MPDQKTHSFGRGNNKYISLCKLQCDTCVADTCIIHIFQTCNTPETPHMYYNVVGLSKSSALVIIKRLVSGISYSAMVA